MISDEFSRGSLNNSLTSTPASSTENVTDMARSLEVDSTHSRVNIRRSVSDNKLERIAIKPTTSKEKGGHHLLGKPKNKDGRKSGKTKHGFLSRHSLSPDVAQQNTSKRSSFGSLLKRSDSGKPTTGINATPTQKNNSTDSPPN